MAQSICHEAGKPIAMARVEVRRAIEVFRLAAAELSRFGGSVVPVDLTDGTEGVECEVRRFPAGVVVGIVPFNFPLNLGAHKVAPALAVGAPIRRQAAAAGTRRAAAPRGDRPAGRGRPRGLPGRHLRQRGRRAAGHATRGSASSPSPAAPRWAGP